MENRYLISEIKKFLRKNKRNRRYRRVVCLLACVLFFGISYIMIMPAVTMENSKDIQEETGVLKGEEASKQTRNTPGDLSRYVNGLTVKDSQGAILEKNEEGTYTIKNSGCAFELKLFSEAAIEAGEYAYQLPTGLKPFEANEDIKNNQSVGVYNLGNVVAYGEGENEQTIGSYAISENGLITVTFGSNTGTNVEVIITGNLQPGDLSEYVDSLKVFDSNNVEVPDNGDGTYTITNSGCTFKLALFSRLPIPPGVYTYQLPSGLMPYYAEGKVKYGSITIGSYVISVDGLITVTFESHNYTDVTGFITGNLDYENAGDDAPVSEGVNKTGGYDPETGTFRFSITAVLPANISSGSKVWYIKDFAQGVFMPEVKPPDLSLADSITAKHVQEVMGDGTIITDYDIHIPDIKDAGEPDQIAYYWDSSSEILYFVNRCSQNCTDNPLNGYSGWCKNWHQRKNIVITIEYTDAASEDIINKYSGAGWNSLFYKFYANQANLSGNTSNLQVDIPNLIQKSLKQAATEDNQYVAAYEVSVNESMTDLSKWPRDLLITDTMTNLSYLPGSMTITRSDGRILLPNEEYTATPTDSGVSVLLLKDKNILGPFEYTITYKTQVTGKEEGIPGNLNYGNTASFNDGPSAGSSGTASFAAGWSWDHLSVRLTKTNQNNPTEVLPGAVFGIYTSDGTLMGRKTTGEDGTCVFSTNRADKIFILRDNAYYIQEIKAPDGYNLDDKKHWFYFSETENQGFKDSGYTWFEISGGGDTWGNIGAADTPGYVLPATGGTGTMPYRTGGILLLTAAVLYGYSVKYRRYRRNC